MRRRNPNMYVRGFRQSEMVRILERHNYTIRTLRMILKDLGYGSEKFKLIKSGVLCDKFACNNEEDRLFIYTTIHKAIIAKEDIFDSPGGWQNLMRLYDMSWNKKIDRDEPWDINNTLRGKTVWAKTCEVINKIIDEL